jgi:2-polyprenyl-3-methyl-5-hydroxy-6-metoxy-1,4-benzoquinol methylase
MDCFRTRFSGSPTISRAEEARLEGEICGLKNVLPNSGGIPFDPESADPYAIAARMKNMAVRRSDAKGFEGLALDDALVFTDPYKDWSFVPLARTIARLVCQHSGKQDFSILELGCGSGVLGHFLGAVGIRRYLGVDANPLAIRHSPHIRERAAHYRCLDLQEDIDLRYTFDAVCSFEVLEHLREDRLDAILATIRRHMGPTSIFLGTASLRTDTDVHITVHEREWWLGRFKKHSLREKADHACWEAELERNHPFNWDKTNTNVFVLESAGP